MENALTYYYNINISNLKNINNEYYFNDSSNLYKLQLCNYSTDYIKNIYEINLKMTKNTLISEIIPTVQKELVITYDNNLYVLLMLHVNINKPLTLGEIENLSNKGKIKKTNNNWAILWSEKMDYIEKIISENKNSYNLLNKSIYYYMALAENAIEYYNINSYKFSDIDSLYICHKKLTNPNSIEELYNPFNIIFDYRERDIAEYFKMCLFNKNNLNFEYFTDKIKSYNIHLIISRLLYPSYYFNIYDEIFLNNKSEKIIINVIKNVNIYESSLRKLIEYLKKNNITVNVEWLN